MSKRFVSPYGAPYPDHELKTPGAFRVLLASVGNPDYGQNPSAPLEDAEPDRWQSAGSVGEAAGACSAFINENNLGAGNWAGGEVQDVSGKVVARISYNGRAWLPGRA